MHIAHGIVKSWLKLWMISDHWIFQMTRILDDIMFQHPETWSCIDFQEIKTNQKRRWYFIIQLNSSQILQPETSDTDVSFYPATTIPVPPPGHSLPDTGPSFRWCRGVCCSSTFYLGSSGSCGAADVPVTLFHRHEKKPRPLSVDFLEDRPTWAPPSYLQPVVWESNQFYSLNIFGWL